MMLGVNARLAATFHGLGNALVQFIQVAVHGCSIWRENTAASQNPLALF
jgi:hypothetical protein